LTDQVKKCNTINFLQFKNNSNSFTKQENDSTNRKCTPNETITFSQIKNISIDNEVQDETFTLDSNANLQDHDYTTQHQLSITSNQVEQDDASNKVQSSNEKEGKDQYSDKFDQGDKATNYNFTINVNSEPVVVEIADIPDECSELLPLETLNYQITEITNLENFNFEMIDKTGCTINDANFEQLLPSVNTDLGADYPIFGKDILLDDQAVFNSIQADNYVFGHSTEQIDDGIEVDFTELTNACTDLTTDITNQEFGGFGESFENIETGHNAKTKMIEDDITKDSTNQDFGVFSEPLENIEARNNTSTKTIEDDKISIISDDSCYSSIKDQLSPLPSDQVPELDQLDNEEGVVVLAGAKSSSSANMGKELIKIGSFPADGLFFTKSTKFKKSVEGRNAKKRLQQISRDKTIVEVDRSVGVSGTSQTRVKAVNKVYCKSYRMKKKHEQEEMLKELEYQELANDDLKARLAKLKQEFDQMFSQYTQAISSGNVKTSIGLNFFE